MRPLKTLSLMACLVVAVSSFAQDHPNEDRGFKPDKMYSFTNLDHINTFNGNLVITLPIGQKFQVSSMLSYGFSAVYNSNIWDRFYFGPGNVKVGPSTLSNAGAGWSVSLGRFLSWKDPASSLTNEGDYLFITPDGSKHPLYFQFPIPKDPIDSTWKSYDSTYIFLTGRTQDPLVHMPDGTKYSFSDTGDRIHYRLSAIFDRFGNWVNVQYPTVPGYSEVWKVEDSQGHKQTLYFTDAIGTTFPQKLLDRIELETFAGGSATWKFNYSYRFIQRPPSDSTPGLIKVAFLREIVQPGPLGDASGPKYSFTTPGSTGIDPDPSYDTSGNATGRINAMQLPTRGWIEWDLDDLQFPKDPEGLIDLGPNNIVGVHARRQLDRDRNPLGEWKYFHRWGCGGKPCLTPSHWAPCRPDAPRQLVAMVQKPDKTTLVRYYHIYFHPNCWESPGVDWSNNEYALPLTSFTKDPEERRLSWELRTGVNPDHPSVYNEGSIGTGTVLQTYFTHWQMIYAFGGDVTQTYRREQSSRTVFNDDQHCGTTGTETCYKTMSKFGFIDEFGLYRQESEGGNFRNAKFRTRFTNYYGTLNADKDWILGTYTEQCSVDEDTSRLPSRVWDWARVVPVAKCSDLTNAVTTKFKFDRSKGVIDARRTLLGSALSKTDLLTTFTRDTKGNITYERFYGGDTSDQQLSDSESTMFNPPSSAKYEIASTYIYAGTALTRRQSKYTGSSFLILDEDYDKWTGIGEAARDAAGVETSYTYDTLGRLRAITEQTANGQNTTSYIYSDASSILNAVATELATIGGINGTVLSSGSYEYDGLGRLKRTSRLLPNDKVSVVQIDYDSMGRKSRESQPAEYDKHPFGKNVTGYWTSYSYDSFGRPSSVTNPDGGGASFSYLGARKSTRRKWVASSNSGNSLASTTETYDAHGRLVAVTEESGDTSIDKPQGDSITTNYTYDVRGNLTGVSMGTQTRTFEYDGRGFLTKETGPEAGATVFSNFDAMGHALQRTKGGNTLTYVYDAAERLTHVKNAAGDDIKTFDFATANSGADKRNGKLIKSVRRNELQTLGIVEVTEGYQYLFPSGQMSKRSVLVEKVETSGARTTLQQFDYHVDAYDDFGQPKKVRMPVCVSVACEGEGIAQVNNTRKAGFLTSVDGFGTMTYHPSGMVGSVRHTTRDFSTDTYSVRHDMPRPSRITFTGCSATQPYFLPGLVRAKVDPNACGIQVTWPAATLCGGVGNTRYRVLREGVDITGGACITETKFVDRTAVRGNTYLYKIVAEGPAVDRGTGLCQRGQTIELAGKPFEFKSCDTDTTLTVENVRASLGAAARFQAYLGSGNGPLPDEELTFSVLGSLIATARTGTDGKAVLDRTVDAEPGTYAGAISVSYAGGLFPARTGTANLTTACDGLSYGVKPLSLNVLSVGGTFPVIVLTSPRCSWTPIPSLASFIGVEPRTQQKGTGRFDIFVPPLEGSGTRSSNVRVSDKEVTIEQSSSCTFQFSPEVAYVPYKTPFSTSINVTAPRDCSWSVGSDSSWLHLTKSSGSGDGFITFTVNQNNSNPRVATLSLNRGEDKARVNQAGPPKMIAPTLVTNLTGPGSVQNGQFISLRAHIEGTYLEYEWFVNGRPRGKCLDERCESMNLAPGNEGYPAPGQSTSFKLMVSNLLDTVVTREITVSNQGGTCRVPLITDSLFRDFTPWDQNSPFSGYEVQLNVVGLNINNDGELKYQWYRGYADDRLDKVSDLEGGKTDTIKVRPGQTTFYWLDVSNNCGTNISRTAAVYVVPHVPPRVRRRAVRKDFTNDGKADIPWHNTATGQNEIWPMNGATQSSSTIALPPSTANLQLQSIGDMDDNELPDLIFRNPENGQNQVWTMRHSHLLGVSPLETRTDGRWSIGGVADLDNDYNDDIIWHNNATGENEIWFQAGTDHEGTWALPSNNGPAWGLHGADDFNGDGKPDLFFHNRSTGENAVWYMNDAERSFEIGTNSAGSSSSVARRLNATIEPMASSLGTEWMPGMVGDMNGDGSPDIVWRNTATGDNRVWFMNGTTVQQDTELPARSGSEWQIGGGGSTNASTPGGGPDPGTTTTSITVVADPAPVGTAAAVTATLKAGSTGLAQRQMVFLLNGTEVSRLLTDATGSATAAISVTSLAAGTYPSAITVRFDGDHTYSSSFASANLVVLGATPEVTWGNPPPIVYGTPLSAAQLNATANVAGTFAYSPAAGAIVNAGYQTLTVVFTPADASMAPIRRNAILFVNKALSSVTWARPESIAYGTPLSDLQLNATSTLPGEFTYDPAPGALLPAGIAQTLRVTFTPVSANYDVSSATTTIDVGRGGQVIRWSDPAPITYPTPLTDAQLNATVIASGTDPAGTLTYAPPAGTVLAEGVHELKVTAAATASCEAASLTVDIIVNRKSAIVEWTSPEPITYGTPLSATQLNATATVPGTFVYTPAAGAVLDAGTHYLNVKFTPTDTGVEPVSQTVTIRVLKVKPVVTWAQPAAIVYGTPLSSAQLNATANVAGLMVYGPAAGTILNAGTHEVLASFTPTDTRNYEVAAATVMLTVNKARQTITWPSPAPIVYGTALSSTQLNATVSVVGPAPAGALTYNPPAGTVLRAGAAQVLTVTAAATPNYEVAAKSVTIDVLKATPVLTWPQPAPIVYKTLLSSTQLNASADVPGTLVYTPPVGTLLQAGTYTLSAQFTPTDTHNYNNAGAEVTLEVKRANPVLSWTRPASIVYGTPLGATQLNATADVPGAFTYTPAAATILDAGDGQMLSVYFRPEDTRNYKDADASTTIDVARAKQTIRWPAPAPIVYGTPLTSTQLNARVESVGPSPAGALTYTPPSGTVLDAGTRTLTVDAAATRNYEAAMATVTLQVNRAPLSVVVDVKSKLYGAPVPPLTGVLTGVQNNDPITPAYATTATLQSVVGQYPITGSLVDPNHRLVNYNVTITNATLTVLPAPLTISANPASKQYSDPIPAFTATYTGLVLGETPAVLAGALSIQTTGEPRSAPGTYPITIGGLTSANYAITYAGATLTVTPEDARVVITSPRLLSAAPTGPTTVTLTATVKDISATTDAGGDVSPGDIRKATLTFVDRTTNAVLCTAPLALVTETDERMAAGTCTFTREFGTTLPVSLTIGARVAGYYARDGAGDDVTHSIGAAPADFITGNGAVEIATAAGKYAPTLKSQSRFDLNLRYDKKKASFKGKFTFRFSRVVEGGTRQYELALVSASSLSIRRTTPGGVAAIVGTATLRDVTAPSKPVVLVAAAPLIVTATDGGKPPARDQLSVMFLGAGAFMVTGWDGTGAVEQLVRRATGDDDDDDDDDDENGNITVHYKNDSDDDDEEDD